MSAPTREQIAQAVRDKLAQSFSNDSVAYCIQVMAVGGFSPDEIRALLKECEPKAPQPEPVRDDHVTTAEERAFVEAQTVAQPEPVQEPVKQESEPVAPKPMSFREIAEPLIKMGVPITPVRPGTKRAFLPDFPTTATTDLEQIKVWDAQFPGHNAACVARPVVGEVFFWEVDSPNVRDRVLQQTGHDIHEIKTFKVRSRPGRGHFYFRHTPSTLDLPNLSQAYVVGQDWSLRANREYVVAPGSIHPDTGEPYTVVSDAPIVEAPQWLLDWLLSQKVEKQSTSSASTDSAPRSANGRVPHGAIHGFMLTQAGKLRQQGLNQSEIEPILLRLVHENCEPPIDDDKVRAMAKSICNYEPGDPRFGPLVLNQTAAQPTTAPPTVAPPVEELNIPVHAYPKFPTWVMEGTSIYEGFVKPICAVNSRVDYFMWMPTAVMMMNYVGTKVRVPLKKWKPSFYLVLIGEKDKAHKSSSMKDGMQFLEFAGALTMYSKEVKNAEGRSLVWEAGSPEGLGTDMQRINCKNAILFYDELSSLASKAKIEGSGMNGALLKMYESNNFSNSVKTKKDAFAVAPDSYVASLITATTDERFEELWGQFAGDDTGMNSRFTFILQPEKLPDEELEHAVPFQQAALETRKLIDKAVNQGTFQFDFGFDGDMLLKECMKVCGGRAEIRAEKWALYFAIDLGRNVIDTDCIERGVALAKYEEAVKKYLEPEEADSKLASLQQKMVRLLERAKGHNLPMQAFRAQSGERKYGTDMWRKALLGLIAVDVVSYNVKTGDKGLVQLLRQWGRDSDGK